MNNRHRSKSAALLKTWQAKVNDFSEQPSWEDYTKLRGAILSPRLRGRRADKDELLDQLDREALLLCQDQLKLKQIQQAIALALNNEPFDSRWPDDQFSYSCRRIVQIVYNLDYPPGYALVRELASSKLTIPNDLSQAFAQLQAGNPLATLSNDIAQPLLLWAQAKYPKWGYVQNQVKAVRQRLAEKNEPEALAQMNNLISHLPPKKDDNSFDDLRQVPSSPVGSSTGEVVADLLAPVLTGWVQTTAEFASLYQAQAGELVQRDDFITLLQQQLDDASDNKRQAQENAEAQIKQQMMAFMAEPLTMLQQAAGNDANTNQLRLVYQSFEQALAELQIFPIGKIGRQFEVGPEDMVRPEDGQPVSGCQVEQVSLGWQLRLNTNNTRPLVRPTVRRVDDT